MATKPQDFNTNEMNDEEMKEYLAAKEMLIRDRDKIMAEVAILSFKVKAAQRFTTPQRF